MINLVTGATFYFGGFADLAVLGTQANVLAFRLNDVVFSFAVGATAPTGSKRRTRPDPRGPTPRA
jgi:hypothetical protein